jgi:4-amino-4-deoxy-L-arabinose transferase-like glycosyltransferase
MERPRVWQKDLGAILLLTLLVIGVRVWMLNHTVVAARDSIGYIRYALEFERYHEDGLGLWDTWEKALNKNHQHPGYPLTVLAMSVPVCHVLGGVDAESMRLSAQLASNLAAILLILPTFYIGKLLFDRRVGFWGALLFQILPVTSHLLSDAISEPLFLLFACSALLFAMQALRDQSPRRLLLAGVFGGLSYLTRPEGVLVIVAALLALVAVQSLQARRWPWGRWAGASAALVLPAVAIGSFYVLATGKFTNKPSLSRIINQDQTFPSHTDVFEEDARARRTVRSPQGRLGRTELVASVWAALITPGGSVVDRLMRGFFAINMELIQGFHYWGALLVFAGWCWYWRRLLSQPAAWVFILLGVLYLLLLLFLVVSVWYVSDRHVQILVLGGCYLLAAVLCDLPATLVGWWTWLRGRPRAEISPRWSVAFMVVFVVLCFPRTFQPLHLNRLGHLLAGTWLAQHAQAGDVVEDDHCWAHFYAGKVFEEGRKPQVAPGYQPVCYIVVTRSRDPEIGRVRSLNEAKIRDAQGQIVYHWPEKTSAADARVVVYSLPRSASAPFVHGY